MNFKMLILGALTTVLFNGCGYVDRGLSYVTGSGSETCQDGVMYLQFSSGATVKYEQNGSIATCGK